MMLLRLWREKIPKVVFPVGEEVRLSDDQTAQRAGDSTEEHRWRTPQSRDVPQSSTAHSKAEPMGQEHSVQAKRVIYDVNDLHSLPCYSSQAGSSTKKEILMPNLLSKLCLLVSGSIASPLCLRIIVCFVRLLP